MQLASIVMSCIALAINVALIVRLLRQKKRMEERLAALIGESKRK